MTASGPGARNKVLAYNPCMFHALQSLAAEGLVSRATLLANHVIGAEPAAMQRLQPHAGKRLRITLQGWPTLLPPMPALAFLITPAGLVEWCGLEAVGAVELEVSVDASNPLALAARAAAGERPKIDVSGDAQFAADVSWLADHLRWDVQDDLERIVGPGPAREIARFASAVAGALREAAVTLGALARRPRGS